MRGRIDVLVVLRSGFGGVQVRRMFRLYVLLSLFNVRVHVLMVWRGDRYYRLVVRLSFPVEWE